MKRLKVDQKNVFVDKFDLSFVRPINMEPSIRPTGIVINDRTFSFLNITKNYPDKIDWDDLENGKLWSYNLNYFEFLHDETLLCEAGLGLIHDFIHNLQNISIGLEPYPISLRLINWIKFLSFNKIHDEEIYRCLYIQTGLLKSKIEYHIGGNHVLENGFGLLFGSFVLNQKQWLDEAKEIITRELKKQILSDGAHYELSPMYHSLILFRILDTINLVKNNSHDDINFLSMLEEKACIMLGWLQVLAFGGLQLPNVNDSADGIAPAFSDLMSYASGLGIESRKGKLDKCGYRKTSQGGLELFMDMAPLGPDEQPGHAHADTLQFLLYVDGIPHIVEAGTSTYEENEIRSFERSTAAHNTVEIFDTSSSDVWKSFRVGRRAKITSMEENDNSLSASHNGYAHKGIIHKRLFQYTQHQVTITDHLIGKHKQSGVAHFHFHPDLTIVQDDKGFRISKVLSISFSENEGIMREKYMFAKGFNRREEAGKLKVYFSGHLVTRILLGV